MKKTAAFLLIILLAQLARAADLQKLVRDTQQIEHTEHGFTFVWWIPSEFWDAALKESPQVSAEQRAKFVASLEDYTIFAVVVADIGPIGGVVPKSREEVVAGTAFKVGDDVLPLLDEATLSPDARNLVSIMKPMLSNMLGQMGKGMEFLFYSNKAHGAKILNPIGTKRFSYTVFGKRFSWRLPLGSLLPPKMDAETGEVFPGDYRFSPYTGKTLTTAEGARHAGK